LTYIRALRFVLLDPVCLAAALGAVVLGSFILILPALLLFVVFVALHSLIKPTILMPAIFVLAGAYSKFGGRRSGRMELLARGAFRLQELVETRFLGILGAKPVSRSERAQLPPGAREGAGAAARLARLAGDKGLLESAERVKEVNLALDAARGRRSTIFRLHFWGFLFPELAVLYWNLGWADLNPGLATAAFIAAFVAWISSLALADSLLDCATYLWLTDLEGKDSARLIFSQEELGLAGY
jgi:hypothetical protein